MTKPPTKTKASIDLASSVLYEWEQRSASTLEECGGSFLQDLQNIVSIAYTPKTHYKHVLDRAINCLNRVSPSNLHDLHEPTYRTLVDRLSEIASHINIRRPLIKS